MKLLIPVSIAAIAITSTGVGVLTSYASSTSISSSISKSHENWKSRFNLVGERLRREGVENVPEWKEEIWKKWISRLHKFVPKDLQHSIVDEMWAFSINEMLNSNSNDFFFNSAFMDLMNGEKKMEGQEYRELIEKLKSKRENKAEITIVKEVGEALDEQTKKEVEDIIRASYRLKKDRFKEVRGELTDKQRKDVPEWSDEMWNKTVAGFYIRIPEVERGKVKEIAGEVWISAVHRMFWKKENTYAREMKAIQFTKLIKGEEKEQALKTLEQDLEEIRNELIKNIPKPQP